MAVHRIDDNAEALLRRLAAAEGKKPSEFLGDLVRDYAKGLSFGPEGEAGDDVDIDGSKRLQLGTEKL